MTAPLLELRDICKHFPIRGGLPFLACRQTVRAVRDDLNKQIIITMIVRAGVADAASFAE